MSTLAVVEEILRDAAVPMSVREIVERAGETLPTKSKTPDTVVARDLSMDIKKKGEASLFMRTSPGRYAVREVFMKGHSEQQQNAVTAPTSTVGTHEQSPQATSVVESAIQGERAGTQRVSHGSDTSSSSSMPA